MGLKAESEHDGEDYAAYLGAGYKMDAMGTTLIPIASIQYINHQEDSFTETGAGIMNLTVDDIDTDSILGTLGLRWTHLFEVGDVTLVPNLSAQWAHEFGDTAHSVDARFAGSTVGAFTVDGVDATEDTALLGVGLTAFLMEHWSVFVDYEAELGDNFQSHNVSGGLRITF
jgi:outer membrane autotransporter protein